MCFPFLSLDSLVGGREEFKADDVDQVTDVRSNRERAERLGKFN